MGGGVSSAARKHPPGDQPQKEGIEGAYAVLGEYFNDLKSSGLNSTEVFDALKRKEEHIRQIEKKKRLSLLQSGSIKVLALNQLSINIKSNDDIKRIGYHSEKISKQLRSAKETVKGLKLVQDNYPESEHLRSRISGKHGFMLDTFDEKIKLAESHVTFLASVEEDMKKELVQIRKQSEKASSRAKRSVKIHIPEEKESEEESPTKPFVQMRNKPVLKLRINSDSSIDAPPLGELVKDNGDESKDAGSRRSSREEAGAPPSNSYFMSPRGTVRLGEFKIGERGLLSLNSYVIGSRASDRRGESKTSEGRSGGFIDFLELCLLGCGASATVKEAIHVPSFTLVALKMMPIYNQEKRKHVGRELAVLYKNLAELSLVDESLDRMPSSESETSSATSLVRSLSAEAKSGRSQYVLAMYDAFANPRSGLINLVVEYMDGGSLADLVANGGCQDEGVLADIATQVLKGLYFLHTKLHMHVSFIALCSQLTFCMRREI